jgi:hypothetical protein
METIKHRTILAESEDLKEAFYCATGEDIDDPDTIEEIFDEVDNFYKSLEII